MSQTRKGSALEAITNVFVGFAINATANVLLFPMLGWHITASQNIRLGIAYTCISLARSYSLRRFYEWRSRRAAR